MRGCLFACVKRLVHFESSSSSCCCCCCCCCLNILARLLLLLRLRCLVPFLLSSFIKRGCSVGSPFGHTDTDTDTDTDTQTHRHTHARTHTHTRTHAHTHTHTHTHTHAPLIYNSIDTIHSSSSSSRCSQPSSQGRGVVGGGGFLPSPPSLPPSLFLFLAFCLFVMPPFFSSQIHSLFFLPCVSNVHFLFLVFQQVRVFLFLLFLVFLLPLADACFPPPPPPPPPPSHPPLLLLSLLAVSFLFNLNIPKINDLFPPFLSSFIIFKFACVLVLACLRLIFSRFGVVSMHVHSSFLHSLPPSLPPSTRLAGSHAGAK